MPIRNMVARGPDAAASTSMSTRYNQAGSCGMTAGPGGWRVSGRAWRRISSKSATRLTWQLQGPPSRRPGARSRSARRPAAAGCGGLREVAGPYGSDAAGRTFSTATGGRVRQSQRRARPGWPRVPGGRQRPALHRLGAAGCEQFHDRRERIRAFGKNFSGDLAGLARTIPAPAEAAFRFGRGVHPLPAKRPLRACATDSPGACACLGAVRGAWALLPGWPGLHRLDFEAAPSTLTLGFRRCRNPWSELMLAPGPRSTWTVCPARQPGSCGTVRC